MAADAIRAGPAEEGDRFTLALLFAAVAEERDGIAGHRLGRSRGLHKQALGVFPHNEAATALCRKFGFAEEGRRARHIRRANGEL